MPHATDGHRRSRPPRLLILVYGVFLLLVGITASALVALASQHLLQSALSSSVASDRALVEVLVREHLLRADLQAGGPSATRAVELSRVLRGETESEIIGIQIWARGGRLVAASDGSRLDGGEPPGEVLHALAGAPDAPRLNEPVGSPARIEEFWPITGADGAVLAAVSLQRDATSLLARIQAAQRDILAVTLAAASALALVLFLIFRAAHRRIGRQHRQLVEAQRTDPLSGLLNHGAIVAQLAERLEAARDAAGKAARGVAVVLVDVDNFRLLNETHGHDAGDEVLTRVARLLAAEAGQADVGRFGPDELLVILEEAEDDTARALVDRLRTRLEDEEVRFGESERLPISVSAGVACYPAHAAAVTELLSAATVALTEAKGSGGNATAVARGPEEEPTSVGSFDVLHGLVIAVDTKDRYTKLHSEDVARYAVFLARRLGLDEELCRTLHLAGLLHDIGKIGIPDALLRKPGRLTAEEYDVFKQHVALGEAIVRDVPRVELVRAGIRHHHERWDGRGYLEGLEGEAIPFIGRVLAVADAFSAMTTTRPYRKALPVEEALKRLGDAVGSQLQEELVTEFIRGIETAPDAPLPGEPSAGIWQVDRWVA